MSSTHHMDQAVVIFHHEDRARDDIYILFEKTAESNVRNERGGLCPEWGVVAIGSRWEVITEIVHMSASCEGGMLKFRGRDIKPEGYIGLWRRAIDDARTSLKPGLNVPPDFSMNARLVVLEDQWERLLARCKGTPTIAAVLARQFSVEKVPYSSRMSRLITVDTSKRDDMAAMVEAASADALVLGRSLSISDHRPSRRHRW